MIGVDISNWNSFPANYEFYIIKASEGIGWKDKLLDSHYNTLVGNKEGKPSKTKLYGFYHYARPEGGNDPIKEADWFLSLVGHHKGEAIFALDFEGKALTTPNCEDWALKWLRRVEEKTGYKPLIYLQASALGKFTRVAREGFPLWVAHWGVTNPTIGIWDKYTIWQYSSTVNGKSLDVNRFNGSFNDFKALCGASIESDVDVEVESGDLTCQLQPGDILQISTYNENLYMELVIDSIDGNSIKVK